MASIFSVRLMDSNIMKVGGRHHHQRISTFHFQDLLCKPGNFDSVVDPLEICPKIFLHFQSDSLPEQILFLRFSPLPYLFGHGTDTLLGIGTPLSTAKIQFRVDDFMTTAALTPDLILEELDLSPTFWT